MIEKIPGQQIYLRKLRRNDAASITRHINDVTIARGTFIPHPYKLEYAETFIRQAQREWRRGTAYHFGIEYRETGHVIGGLGLEGTGTKHRNTEAGYWLSKKFRGRGIMVEALRLALGFCFNELKLVRVHAHVMVGNDVSARVLEKVGFKREGCLRKRIKHRGRYRDLLLFAILREEFQQRR
jgi:RimJ/RimL family protein N-acetyltransferase